MGHLHEKIKVLNIEIDNFSKAELLADLKHGVVFTPNVDHLVKLQKDEEFYQIYQQADYKVCDSRILVLKSRMGLLPQIKEQIAGSDLFPEFCEFHRNNDDIKIFLLGGSSTRSLQSATDNINHKVGRPIIVGGYSPPFGFEFDDSETEEIIARVRHSGANVLAVGVGAPKQEKWIMKYKHLLPNIDIFFAIGATIEFEAGTVKRSPSLLTKLGLEWAYRIYKEPLRLWKRYLVHDLPIFVMVVKQRLGVYHDPWIAETSVRSNVPVEA